MKTPPELDQITDAVLHYHPKPKSKAAKRRKRRLDRRTTRMKDIAGEKR